MDLRLSRRSDKRLVELTPDVVLAENRRKRIGRVLDITRPMPCGDDENQFRGAIAAAHERGTNAARQQYLL